MKRAVEAETSLIALGRRDRHSYEWKWESRPLLVGVMTYFLPCKTDAEGLQEAVCNPLPETSLPLRCGRFIAALSYNLPADKG